MVIVGLLSAKVANAAVIFSDNFDRPNSSTLGSGWVEDSGDWFITSNQLMSPLQDDAIVHNTNSPSSADYYVQVDAESASSTDGSPAVLARYIDANNFYLFQTANGLAQLFKRVNGNWTILDNEPFTRTANTFNTYRIEVNNNQINGYIDGVLVTSATDISIISFGTGGLRRGGTLGAVNFDNYEVGDILTPAPTPVPLPSNNFFSDDFNRADSSILVNGWIEDRGDWQINSNQLVTPVQDDVIVHNTNAPSSPDYYVQVEAESTSSTLNYPAVLARFIDANNFYLFQSGNNVVQLYKRVNGSWTVLDTEPYTRTANTFYTYRIQVNGNQIKGFINGAQVAYAVDGSLINSGYGGLRRGGNDVPIVFDNFNMGYLPLAPVMGAISVSPNPVQVNTITTASAFFTDPNILSTHTASWNWGDGNITMGTVIESNGTGSVSDNHTYSVAGVYIVTLRVTNSDNVGTTSTYQFVSVYNPTSQGIFTAGQNFSSPPGAYIQNPALTGTVKFGLSYKYQGAVPVGDRQFIMNFKSANLTFNATTVYFLGISNNTATLTGTGTINDSGNYNFLVTGINSGGVRIQIADPANNNNIIYDTQPGAAETASPTTSVNGQIVVHN